MDTLVVSLTALTRVGLIHVSLDTVYIDTVFFHQLRLDNCEAIVLTDSVQHAASPVVNLVFPWAMLMVTSLSTFLLGFFLAALLASGKDN